MRKESGMLKRTILAAGIAAGAVWGAEGGESGKRYLLIDAGSHWGSQTVRQKAPARAGYKYEKEVGVYSFFLRQSYMTPLTSRERTYVTAKFTDSRGSGKDYSGLLRGKLYEGVPQAGSKPVVCEKVGPGEEFWVTYEFPYSADIGGIELTTGDDAFSQAPEVWCGNTVAGLKKHAQLQASECADDKGVTAVEQAFVRRNHLVWRLVWKNTGGEAKELKVWRAFFPRRPVITGWRNKIGFAAPRKFLGEAPAVSDDAPAGGYNDMAVVDDKDLYDASKFVNPKDNVLYWRCPGTPKQCMIFRVAEATLEAGAKADMLPVWHVGFAEEFKRRRGYDMKPYMPVYIGCIVENRAATEKFMADARVTLDELAAEGK